MAKAPIKKTIRKKKKVFRQVSSGKAFIQATYNNTIVTLTDVNGNVLSWSSAGHCGFKGPKKATPYAATVIVKDAVAKAQGFGKIRAAARIINSKAVNFYLHKGFRKCPGYGKYRYSSQSICLEKVLTSANEATG